MLVVACSEAMTRWMALNGTRRRKMHGMAWRRTTRSFGCDLWVTETSKGIPFPSSPLKWDGVVTVGGA